MTMRIMLWEMHLFNAISAIFKSVVFAPAAAKIEQNWSPPPSPPSIQLTVFEKNDLDIRGSKWCSIFDISNQCNPQFQGKH